MAKYGNASWETLSQVWASRQQMLQDMDAAGIDRCVLLGWYWENFQTCVEANQWHSVWLKEDPERFIAFLSLRPDIPDLRDYLKKAQDDGFQGIGESHPWAQGFSLRDKLWMEAMEFACEAGWPVTFHTTDPDGKDYPEKHLPPWRNFMAGQRTTGLENYSGSCGSTVCNSASYA